MTVDAYKAALQRQQSLPQQTLGFPLPLGTALQMTLTVLSLGQTGLEGVLSRPLALRAMVTQKLQVSLLNLSILAHHSLFLCLALP